MLGTEQDSSGNPVAAGYVKISETVASVGVTAGPLIEANPRRRYLLLQNIGLNTVYLRLDGSAPVPGAALALAPGGFIEFSYRYDNIFTNAVQGIVSTGTLTVMIDEGA